MNRFKSLLAVTTCWLVAAPPFTFAASHREAPITALDHPADITDFYAFVSYDHPDRVTFILNTDAFLEPANGPNYFPFDPEITYRINIDNDYDAVEEIAFEFKFTTEIRAPGVFTGFVGAGSGINSPSNAPLSAKGTRPTAVIPPAITALDGAGAAGLSLRQSYTVTRIDTAADGTVKRTDLTPSGQKLFAVPSNAGPRTMPNYPALAAQGIYTVGNNIRVFAGTADDPFFIDLGAAFDSLNLRAGAYPSGVTGVMTVAQDSDDTRNTAPDTVSGYNVNSIAIEVPIAQLIQPGMPVIGAWGATYRSTTSVRAVGMATQNSGDLVQIQRMGNPLINELIIGTGDKDKWSQTQPKDDSQFAAYDLDPLLARALNAVFGIQVPNAPRTDLLPLVQYAGKTPGPIADLLRLDTSVPPTALASRSRLGGLAGDAAGFPNGRRVTDDVTDIALRVVAGALAGSPYSTYRLGDGVNHNDVATQETFPYVAFAQSGHDRVHINPGGPGCYQPVGTVGGSPCPVQ